MRFGGLIGECVGRWECGWVSGWVNGSSWAALKKFGGVRMGEWMSCVGGRRNVRVNVGL